MSSDPVEFIVDPSDLNALSDRLNGIKSEIEQYDAGVTDPWVLGRWELVQLFTGGSGTNDFYNHWGTRRDQICSDIDSLTAALQQAAQGYSQTEQSITSAMPVQSTSGPPA